MKRIVMTVACLVFAGAAVAANPLEGRWRTAADDNGNSGIVEVAPCGEKLCGTLVRALGPDGAEIPSDNIGKRIFWDMEPQGTDRYGRGRVWSPDRNQDYRAEMVLNGDTVELTGIALGGLVRRKSLWRRAD